jgi:signal transduction histidine kinase
VKDTGIGIPADHLDKIFDRFYQVDGAVSRQYGGTGLGLSICKAYVEMMGGAIKVESEFEKGTNFTFTIAYKEV